MEQEQLPLDFLPAVKGKKQLTPYDLIGLLRGKVITLSCGHKYFLNKGGLGKTMIVYADGTTACHDCGY